LKEKETLTTAPDQDVSFKERRLTADERTSLGKQAYQIIDQGLSDRAQFDSNLADFLAIYEMQTSQKDDPWPDSSNVFIPLAARLLDGLAARLAGILFVPRFFLVNGNTEEAASTAPQVERYYNTELWRFDWLEDFYQWMHLSLRDGTSAIDVLFEHRTSTRVVESEVPVLDEATGAPIIESFGGPNGEPPRIKTEKKESNVTFDLYKNVRLEPVEMEDIVVSPAWAYDWSKAGALSRRLYLYEADLKAMVAAGDLWQDAVDVALESLNEGQDERADARQGVESASIGGQINVSGTVGATGDGNIHIQKGPLRIYRMQTSLFDLDKDGIPEENLLWIHEKTQTLLGYKRFPYWHGHRTLVPLQLMPRPLRAYGYSLIERLAGLNMEVNTIRNSRNDLLSLYLSPPLKYKLGSRFEDQDQRWQPGAKWEVEAQDDIELMTLPQFPVEAFTEESSLVAEAEMEAGSTGPSIGQSKGSRQTKAQVTANAAETNIRTDFMAARARKALREIFYQLHRLKLQYQYEGEADTDTGVTGQPEHLEIPKEVLGRDYALDIAGSGGPLDRQSRAQETMFLYSLLMKNPLIMSNPARIYNVTRMVLEEFDRPDVPALLGTQEQAVQDMQKAQQQAAAQAAAGQKPPGGGGAPPNGVAGAPPIAGAAQGA
jgi:hypothetical protein